MIKDDSPRWVKLLPSTVYGCSWIVVAVAGAGVGYVWLAEGRFGLSGAVARVVGLGIASAVTIPVLVLLSRSRLRTAAMIWGRRVSLDDARRETERLVSRYRTHRREQDLRKARRIVTGLRARWRDTRLGEDLEDLIDTAESDSPSRK